MKKLITALLLTMFTAVPAMASTVTLDVLDSNIVIGETFSVDVILDSEGLGEELLGFGCDVDTTAGATYDGFTLNSLFQDWTYPGSADVIGVAVPSVLDDDITLATLFFTATQEGAFTLSLDGTVDMGGEKGLFYEISDVSFYVSETININAAPAAPIPEPSTILLFGLGILGMIGADRRRRKP